MAIDVVIKQKLLGGKTMPLEVILGKHLQYGNFVNDQLNVGELGEREFVAYDPNCIGRGFSVVWNPQEKRRIVLRLPMPSTAVELRGFYDAVARMAEYWDARLTVDGNRIQLADFLAGFGDMVKFNNNAIREFFVQALEEDHTLSIYSAMWPLSIGREEVTRFAENPDYFTQWLHEKQTVDAYFATPRFYMGDNGVYARYILTNNMPAVLPLHPAVPFGATDPTTGQQLECEDWGMILVIDGEKVPLCEMEYASFLEKLPNHKKTKFDADRFLLDALTEDELRSFAK